MVLDDSVCDHGLSHALTRPVHTQQLSLGVTNRTISNTNISEANESNTSHDITTTNETTTNITTNSNTNTNTKKAINDVTTTTDNTTNTTNTTNKINVHCNACKFPFFVCSPLSNHFNHPLNKTS